MSGKNYVAVAGDDWDLLQKHYGMHEKVEVCLNFGHSPSTGFVFIPNLREVEVILKDAKEQGIRAGGFRTEEGALRGLRKVLRIA